MGWENGLQERADKAGVHTEPPARLEPGASSVTDSRRRDRLIASLYEAALRPSGYDAFMEAWAEHIERALADGEVLRAAWEEGELPADRELEDHFRRVVALLEQMGHDRTERTVEAHVRNHPGFALLLDARGKVLETSASAGDCASFEALRERLTPESVELLSEVLVAAGGSGADKGGSEGNREGGGERVLCATGNPRHMLAKACRPTTANEERDGKGGSRETFGVLIDALDVQWSQATARTLATSFRLSHAETQVARGLSRGLSLRDLADETGKSEHTLRNQLKSVLAKTGTGTQADLMRLVALLAGTDEAPAPLRMRGDEETLRLPDGRLMEVHHRGPGDGRPVLFIHGMLDGTAVTAHAERLLHDRGLSFVCPVRPGFGRSDPHGPIPPAPEAFAEDVVWLVETMGLERPVIVGHMSGAVHAYALAARLNGAAAGVVNVSGGVPILSHRQFATMTPRQRIVAYTARYAPRLLPTLMEAGIAQIRGKDVETFMDALYPDCHDGKVIRRKGFGQMIQDGYRFAVAQGPAGFASDAWHVVRDWSARVRACPVPVTCVHGRHDPVVSAVSVEAFARRHLQVRALIHEGAGQLVFYEHPDFVLDAVEAALGTPAERSDRVLA